MPEPLPAAPRPLVAYGYSHPGQQREENEDAFGLYADERLFVVADGMGGRAAGDVAARLAVSEVDAFFRHQHADPRAPWPFPIDRAVSFGANLLNVGLKVANRKIRETAAADPACHRMGATIAALALGETQAVVGHVGDARVYRLRDGKLDRLTRDHSVLEEMLAARPNMSAEEIAAFAHRNVVTRALGSKDEVEPTVALRSLAAGDVFLLCSDGVWGSVPDDRIALILAGTLAAPGSREASSTLDLERATQAVVAAANDAGGPDNATAVLVRVL